MSNPRTDQLVDWLDQIQRNGINLSTWEEQFVGDQVARVEQWGDRIRFSDAQADQIERIYSDKVPGPTGFGRRDEGR